MATYPQLLINAGSGIVDRGKQSKQEPGGTLIIGLGGTGSDLVMKLKREVYKQLQPDNMEAEIPEYKNIKFMIMDSDRTKVRAQKGYLSDIDERTEFVDISNAVIKTRFKETETMKRRPDMTWLDFENIKLKDAIDGAGGIRQVGRFLIMDKASEIYQKIKTTMNQAMVGTNTIHVHIIAGISGGTGSGTFLDVCYMVREALHELGHDSARTSGYFFLPDVNLSVPAVSSVPEIADYVAANGYAAMQELDYCMNFENNHDCFEQRYDKFNIKNVEPPVDLCYLISTKNSDGTNVVGGYDYAMGVVTDYIISFLAKVEAPKPTEEGKDEVGQALTLSGHIANLNSIKQNIKMHSGAGLDYNILGASVAEMPLSEIATYLGAKLFEEYSDIFERIPTEQERDAFIKSKKITYEDIRKLVSKGCAAQMVFPERFDDKLYKARGNHPFLELADNFLSNNTGIMESNAKSLKSDEALRDYVIPQNADALLAIVFKALCEDYVTKLEYGPVYAHLMISGGTNKNLVHAVDGMIATNKEHYEHEGRQSRLRDDDYENAKARMDAAGLLNSGARIKEYKNALNNLYVHHYKMDMYEKIDDVLKQFKKLLIQLDNGFFSILQEVMFTLKNTFEENIGILTQKGKVDESYSWKILSINEIIDGLDEEVKKLDVNQTLYRLMMGIVEHSADWRGEDEAKISKMISAFVIGEFSEATKKTITDYLKEKYQEPDISKLANKIEQEIIIKQLAQKAKPMFWKNISHRDAPEGLNYLTVPYDSEVIKQASQNYIKGNKSFSVRPSDITDKISMMCFHSGMPLYAYQGLREYESKYMADIRAGKHLFGKGEKDWNKTLPSPIPYSAREGLANEKLDPKYKELCELFNKAKGKGIIIEDEDKHCDIRVTEELDVGAYVESLGSYEGNPAKAQEVVKKLEGKLTELKEDRSNLVRIPYGNPVAGMEETVTLDFFLMAPVLNGYVRKEVEKYEKLDEMIKTISEKSKGDATEAQFRKAFFEAIFTGVLSYGKTVYYEYEEFGMPKKVSLQDSTMGELSDTGAFFAYGKYKELDEKLRKRIADEVTKRKDADESPERDAAIASLNEKMPQRIQAYLMRHDETTIEHKDIEVFYTEFMKELAAFKLSLI